MHYMIIMEGVPESRMGYGIRAESKYVYRTNKSHSPTRVVVWDNTGRPNKRNGQPVEYGNYGPKDGGNGRWLDPHNKATDDMLSIELTPEASVICANTDMNTGQPGSGQVYDKDADVLRDGDTATLVYGHGGFGDVEITLHFPPGHNGHGHATFGAG